MGIKEKIKKGLTLFQKEVKEPVYIPVVNSKLLTERTIFISGAAGGIGAAIAEACLRSDATVILAGRTLEKLEKTRDVLAKKLKCKLDKIYMCKIDISDVNNIKKILEELTKDIGKIDTLINCAGIQRGELIGKTRENDYDTVLNINTKGTYFMCQEFSNMLIKNNIKGNILNISSVSGIRPAISPYMVSKWGINGLTKGLAKKLIKDDIVVNGIGPGPVATDMIRHDEDNLFYKNAPARRFADPMEIANLSVFLISDMGRMIVGETIYITGGCGTLTLDDIEY